MDPDGAGIVPAGVGVDCKPALQHALWMGGARPVLSSAGERVEGSEDQVRSAPVALPPDPFSGRLLIVDKSLQLSAPICPPLLPPPSLLCSAPSPLPLCFLTHPSCAVQIVLQRIRHPLLLARSLPPPPLPPLIGDAVVAFNNRWLGRSDAPHVPLTERIKGNKQGRPANRQMQPPPEVRARDSSFKNRGGGAGSRQVQRGEQTEGRSMSGGGGKGAEGGGLRGKPRTECGPVAAARRQGIDLLVPSTVAVVAVTGPNTGGKTASLKTLGLACIMAKAGLYLPLEQGAPTPRVVWFDQVSPAQPFPPQTPPQPCEPVFVVCRSSLMLGTARASSRACRPSAGTYGSPPPPQPEYPLSSLPSPSPPPLSSLCSSLGLSSLPSAATCRRVQRALEAATRESLVLLDELGSGTDPAEGAALACTLLEASPSHPSPRRPPLPVERPNRPYRLPVLQDLSGRAALTYVTSHFWEVKELADETPGFLNAVRTSRTFPTPLVPFAGAEPPALFVGRGI